MTKDGKSWLRVNAGRRVTLLLLLPGKSVSTYERDLRVTFDGVTVCKNILVSSE